MQETSYSSKMIITFFLNKMLLKITIRIVLFNSIKSKMNIWLKTENNRRNQLRNSWVSSRSSFGTPLPIIAETNRKDQLLSNSNYSLLSQQNESHPSQSHIENPILQQIRTKREIMRWEGPEDMEYMTDRNPKQRRMGKGYSPGQSSIEKRNFVEEQYQTKSKTSDGFNQLFDLHSSRLHDQSPKKRVLYHSTQQEQGVSSRSSSLPFNRRNTTIHPSNKKYEISSSSSEQQFVPNQKRNIRLMQPETNYDENQMNQMQRVSSKNIFSSNVSLGESVIGSRDNKLFERTFKNEDFSEIKRKNLIGKSLQTSSIRSSFNQSELLQQRRKQSNILNQNNHSHGQNNHSHRHRYTGYSHTGQNSKRFLTTGRKNDIREYIVSIIQYCSNEVGIACYNINTGEVYLSQIIQRLTYLKTVSTIQRFYPQQIIFSSTLENTPLIKQLIGHFKKTSFRPIKRNLFDETKGYYIYRQRANHKQQCNPDNKFLSFAALNSLITFLQSSFEISFEYSAMNIKWHFLEEFLVVDSQTIRDLEIFINYRTKQSNENTFIDNFKCLTAGGTRMLRANILQPLTSLKQIRQRSKLVNYILKNKNLNQVLSKQLQKYKQYQPITAKFIQSPKHQNLKSIKSYLNSIYILSKICFQFQNLRKKLTPFQHNSEILDTLLQKLLNTKLESIRELIRDHFDEDILKNFANTRLRNKKENFIFLFKVNKIEDEFAEVSRLTYSHTLEDIFKIYETIKAKSKGAHNMKLQYNQYRGYYISAKSTIDLNQLSRQIQSDILQITFKNNSVTFSTDILASMNNRLKENENKLIYESESLLLKIIRQIQSKLDILFEANYWISVVDMILSFVEFIKYHSSNHQITFSEPEFVSEVEADEIILEKMRSVWSAQKFHKLSEDVSIFFPRESRLLNIKKQMNSSMQLNLMSSIGYLVILGQMGCLVPAKKFRSSIFGMMASKINIQVNFQSKLSRFQTQLFALKSLLDNSQFDQGKCLILIDQIIRGTQPEEEWALAMASIGHLLQQSNTKSIVLTSDQILFKMIQRLERVSSCVYQDDNTLNQGKDGNYEEIRNMLNQYNFSVDFIGKYDSTNIKCGSFGELLE